ncbi:unnamed protein product [marine sediment metagenome]|uniref:Uncharacterized protein n=1 Tax=marine sediment metagenome TaxID=412755 RepID=X1D6H8_9ZZZZ
MREGFGQMPFCIWVASSIPQATYPKVPKADEAPGGITVSPPYLLSTFIMLAPDLIKSQGAQKAELKFKVDWQCSMISMCTDL